MQLMEFIIAALVGSAITSLLAILGIWFKYYLDHMPLHKQSIFPEPKPYPHQSKNSDNMISTIGAQCVEFDFSKGDPNRKWVSIVYEFNKFGVLTKNDTFDFEVVFERGNFNQVNLELKIPKDPKDKRNGRYDIIDVIKIKSPSDANLNKPIPIKVPLNVYDESKVHNIIQLCFVVRKKDVVNKKKHCYGRYRLQNMSITKK